MEKIKNGERGETVRGKLNTLIESHNTLENVPAQIEAQTTIMENAATACSDKASAIQSKLDNIDTITLSNSEKLDSLVNNNQTAGSSTVIEQINSHGLDMKVSLNEEIGALKDFIATEFEAGSGEVTGELGRVHNALDARLEQIIGILEGYNQNINLSIADLRALVDDKAAEAKGYIGSDLTNVSNQVYSLAEKVDQLLAII